MRDFILGVAGLYFLLSAALAPPPADLQWVPKVELVRLQRYHGTIALKITETTVSIWRDKRWIVVKRREF